VVGLRSGRESAPTSPQRPLTILSVRFSADRQSHPELEGGARFLDRIRRGASQSTSFHNRISCLLTITNPVESPLTLGSFSTTTRRTCFVRSCRSGKRTSFRWKVNGVHGLRTSGTGLIRVGEWCAHGFADCYVLVRGDPLETREVGQASKSYVQALE
jgi:hypothetical protein